MSLQKEMAVRLQALPRRGNNLVSTILYTPPC